MKKLLDLTLKKSHLLMLLLVMYLAVWLRWTTANFDIILDYDPWWFYRHAEELVKNNLIPPKWDELSFFPPGRPVDYYLGWSYTVAIFYVITKIFIPITLMKFSGYFIAFFSAACAIPAYLVGRQITNKWGGLVTAFFAVITPTFLAVSMAGYVDSDAVDVFYTFLAVLTTLYALKKTSSGKLLSKSSILAILLAVFSYWLFAFNWNNSWYIYFIFVAFIPLLIIFYTIESFFSRKQENFNAVFARKLKESRNIILTILLIGIIGEIVCLFTSGWPFNTVPPHQQLLEGLNIVTGKSLLVNISVAELQTINVFSREGFIAVASRIGIIPTILAVCGLVSITLYKLFYVKKISLAEYFAIIWMIISFWLITRGVRFSLLFSMAVATTAGFVVGNLIEFLKNNKEVFVLATVYGLLLFGFIWHLSDNISFSQGAGGMEVDQNWKDALNWLKTNADKKALVSTWWDPGHIIAGYTGLRVHADGAHCGYSCIPYNHDVRIQDMGKTFSTSDENEAANIMKKYMQLTPEQCKEVKQKYGDIVPKDACDPVPEMYFIASYDLIGKYYWLSFFGTGQGRNYAQVQISGQDANGNLIYGDGVLTLAVKNDQLVPILNVPQQGISNAVVKNIIYYQNGVEQKLEYSNVTNSIDGLVFVDPSFRLITYMDSTMQNSVFTKLFFFNGKDLTHFKLVFNNPEVKIFKMVF
jgi:dolichyl-diphosphooligosaccharide--protein glycosyltransferase